MESVFVVRHLNILPNGEECIKFIGVYRSENTARAAVARLATQPGFCAHPEIIDPRVTDDERGFHIGEYLLDKDHWTEGFVTMLGSEEYEQPRRAE